MMREHLKTRESELVALITRLRRFAYSLTGSISEGDDLTQAALERALDKLHLARSDMKLDGWVLRIAHNLWIDELRSRRRRPEPTDPSVLAENSAASGDATGEERVQLAQTRAAIAALPDDQRDVINLVAIAEMSYQEAADTLGVPIGTVMSRLSRARRALAKALGLEEGSVS